MMEALKWILAGLGCWLLLSALVAVAWSRIKSQEPDVNGKSEFYGLMGLVENDPNLPAPAEELAILRCRALL